MKRALLIFGSLIVLLGVGVGVYFYFFAQKATVVVTPGNPTLPEAGQSGAGPENGGSPSGEAPGGVATVAPGRLVQITPGPVALGEVVAPAASESIAVPGGVSVSYIERQSGNVFHYLSRTGAITRTSNRTIPGIQSAAWLPDGSMAFVRYLSGADSATINTYALTSTGLGGFFLPQNLSAIAVSSTSVLTLAAGVNGSVATLVKPDNTKSTALFTSPLSSLRVAFAGAGRYTAFTKPSATLPGYVFNIDKAGAFTRIAGPLNGLVALVSPSGKWALLSYTQAGSMLTKLLNTTTGETISLPLATLADKCVWTNDDASIYCGVPLDPPTGYAYPDDWYQGAASFSDRIWKIDVAGRFAQLVLDFTKEKNASLDATALAIDPQATTLVFVNKINGSLWAFQL